MVYVDDYKAKYRGMIMCHMIADTEKELHAMALKIGVKKIHYQNKPGLEHYDISLSKRKLAVYYGAKEVTTKELIKIKRGV